jgi:hypothetical protein
MMKKVEANLDAFSVLNFMAIIPEEYHRFFLQSGQDYFRLHCTRRMRNAYIHEIAKITGLDYQVCDVYVGSDYCKQQIEEQLTK